MATAIDTDALAALIHQLFDLSDTLGVPPPIQDELGIAARKLRGQLVTLLSARFDEGTLLVTQGNDAISDLNADLQANAGKLASYATFVNKATAVVGVLDQLLSVVRKFL